MQRYINAIIVEPNLPAKPIRIKNDVCHKKQLVGGRLEYTYLEDCNDVVIICNKDCKLLGLPINRNIGHDIIAGSFLIVGDDPEIGEDRSLTDEQLEKYMKVFDKSSIDRTNQIINKILIKNNVNDYQM